MCSAEKLYQNTEFIIFIYCYFNGTSWFLKPNSPSAQFPVHYIIRDLKIGQSDAEKMNRQTRRGQ
jgi:hypothetical protein